MNKNQNGFSILPILLLMIVLGIVAFAAQHVLEYNQRLADGTVGETALGWQGQNSTSGDPELPDSFVNYNNDRLNISFAHPFAWGTPQLTSPDTLRTNDLEIIIQPDEAVRALRAYPAHSYCDFNPRERSWRPAGSYPPVSCEPDKRDLADIPTYGFNEQSQTRYGYAVGADMKDGRFMWIKGIIGGGNGNQASYQGQSERAYLDKKVIESAETLLRYNPSLFR